ncbi:OmpA family protein [Pseudomonas sp. BGr12]|uniref:OmpA family protein n=1 Tax=unclassified Pseudomonas TaxID=196821 RepID=UPI001784AE0C|nr:MULTISPECIES: OmpA family protein [unclassified Pseudomonas]MBD9500296.1 OmpA family protein [Pseudomonas sp. PDM17]MDL2429598.1 OmpA family protein [Pseudomonas sp. BJa5]
MYKQQLRTGLRLAMAAAAAALLSACGTVSNVDSAGKTAEPIFPAMNSASMPEGYYVNLENLGKIDPGMTKNQVMELIGHPQFSEGMFFVREWDYILKFRQPHGQPDKVCQYKVLFDKDMIAQSFHFLPTDCMAPAVVEQVPGPAPEQHKQIQHITLSADATFGFGSSTLRPLGIAALDDVVSKMQQARVNGIDIVGYTDRIGNAAGNEALSLRRAQSVRNYLVSRGVPASTITVAGRGSDDPLVSCPGAKTAAVIECLAPNRRTTITIQTQQ